MQLIKRANPPKDDDRRLSHERSPWLETLRLHSFEPDVRVRHGIASRALSSSDAAACLRARWHGT
jgi:hypothetical protein